MKLYNRHILGIIIICIYYDCIMHYDHYRNRHNYVHIIGIMHYIMHIIRYGRHNMIITIFKIGTI